MVKWRILLHEDFDVEFDALSEEVQDEMLAHAKLLEQLDPQLGWAGPASIPSTIPATRT